MVRPIDVQNLYVRTSDLEQIQQSQQQQRVTQQVSLGQQSQQEIISRREKVRDLDGADSQDGLQEMDQSSGRKFRKPLSGKKTQALPQKSIVATGNSEHRSSKENQIDVFA